MKLFLVLIFSAGILSAAESFTPEQLAAEAVANNPELRFYEKQVTALPKVLGGETPVIVQPLAFPSRESFRRAVLNLDAGLARLYLEEFRFVLAGDVRLKAMEYQAATETAATAQDLAARISVLIKLLEERPTAGVESLLERRILEGAALPFLKQAAESSLQAAILRTQLNGLLGRDPAAALSVAGSFGPLPEIKAANTGTPLALALREAQIARGLLGVEAAAEIESFAIEGWFTREGLGAYEAVAGLTLPGTTGGGTVAQTKERLITDARAKLAREFLQRRLAVASTREVLDAIPAALLDNLQNASELAERQYRVGALGVNLLLEVNREYLAALQSRNDATIQGWRNVLDFELLNLAAPGAGKVTVKPSTNQP